jgi:hypothetical protein
VQAACSPGCCWQGSQDGTAGLVTAIRRASRCGASPRSGRQLVIAGGDGAVALELADPHSPRAGPCNAPGRKRAARQIWPGCALRGTCSPAGTGHQMRRLSGSCWTRLHQRALAQALLGPGPGGRRNPGARPRPACPASCLAGESAGPQLVKAVAVDGKTSQESAAPTAAGSTFSAPPNTAGAS